MKNSSTYKTIFTFILLVLLCGVFFIGQRFVTQKSEVVRELSIKNKQIKDFQFETQLKEQINLLNIQEQQIKNSFISETELLGFIETLEQLALQSNLEITINKVTEEEKESVNDSVSIHPTTFDLQVVGSYEDTITFITLLSQSEKRLVFDKMSMYQSVSDDIVAYTARITLTGQVISYE